ncbi:class I SAM-dependent methyltransferase [Metabacillus halosaccharovorans]|uniref:class I SAM-dependent methyltransferase n=1 Tax=Metabacillus halosaccharovorans TaxID=930124 RepID=UPI001C1F2E24|nr:class I SAM-dependent methyltransferase [Metabacillus halosaccharovorans]MBU7595683.1 class I SAM-dependent methyltransferase [Metabacillus halosaccharovorans]
MIDYGKNLFEGTARYYSQYRPIYSASLIRYLIKKFSLDGKGNMLDLGCGTGQLAFRFSDWFEGIVGIDTEPEMIKEAIRLSKEIRVENIEFFYGVLDKYKVSSNKIFRCVTIAKAFHWMDREKVLDLLYGMVSDEGGIAIIDNFSPNKELLHWQKKVNEIVKQWYGNERRAGNSTYSHPTISHQEIVAKSKFNLESYQIPTYEQLWSIDSIIGNLYSTSYGSKRFLGDNVNSFEQHLKEELLSIEKTGVFKEQINTKVILALKN